jgi:hypothetical protein
MAPLGMVRPLCDGVGRLEKADMENPTTTNWMDVHHRLTELAADQAGLDYEIGTWLLMARDLGVHRRLGYGSFDEYVKKLFGRAIGSVKERLRVAEGLNDLPQMGEALKKGEVNWSCARELSRVAVPANEAEWLGAARGKTSRQIERLVSGRRRGDAPEDPARRELQRHVLRVELAAETMATFREAVMKLQRETGEALDDETAILMMARQVLRGPEDAGRAGYQIALTKCPECERGQQQGRGELIDVGPEVVEMAECDAQHIGNPAAGEPARATQTIPPAVRRQVMSRDHGQCVVPGCSNSIFVDIHHLELRSDGGQHDPDQLAIFCGAHHRALHRGQLLVTGTVSTGLEFSHADGMRYGGAVSPAAAAAQADAFTALRSFGFREPETRRALETVRKSPDVDGSDIGAVVRAALRVLTPSVAVTCVRERRVVYGLDPAREATRRWARLRKEARFHVGPHHGWRKSNYFARE